MIDWSKVAEPSDYSTKVISERALVRWPLRSHSTMRVEFLERELSEVLSGASLDDPRIPKVLTWLDLWPEGSKAVRSITDIWWPLLMRDEGTGLGSCCGHDTPTNDRPCTVVYSTLFDQVGGAEALCHEAGHLRLHALGIDLETHDGYLLANLDDEMFESPIRKDKLRPMSAVLQAQYSYVMICNFDVIIATYDLEQSRAHLDFNLPRIAEGIQTIEKNARWTLEGGQFWSGMRSWTDRILSEGHNILRNNNA